MQLECFVHCIKSQENTAFLLRKSHQELTYYTRTRRACTISLVKSLFKFIDAELQKQEHKLQLAIEIELHPEISVVTRYWNIHFVNDNKVWNPGLIIALLDPYSS